MKPALGAISPLGVLVGGVFDIIASGILGAIAILIFAAIGPYPGNAPIDVTRMTAELLRSPPTVVTIFIIGSLVSVAAGYVAALIAKRHELLNGTLSSILCILQGLYLFVQGNSGHSFGYWAAELIVPPLAGLAGGYIRKRNVGS